jgi:hypothetical protein
MALRKNASLAAVAQHTRAKANRHHNEWSRLVRSCNGASMETRQAIERSTAYIEAYKGWRVCADLAAHLERLAGLPVHDEYGALVAPTASSSAKGTSHALS